VSSYSITEAKNRTDYEMLSRDSDSFLPFTQSYAFGEWQVASGRKVWRFVIENGGKQVGFFQIIKYPLAFGKSYLYIPHGPVLFEKLDERFLQSLKETLSCIEKKEKAVFTRFDFFPVVADQKIFHKYFNQPSAYAERGSYFQPKVDWVIDLSKDEEALLGNMMKDGRYSINLASRKGTTAEMVAGDDMQEYFDIFYGLMQETAKRDGFRLHPEEYYRNIFGTAGNGNADIALFIAENNKKVLSAHLIAYFGRTAFDLYGGSSGDSRELMPNYALQWQAIRKSKLKGCLLYNFGAVEADGGRSGKFGGISLFKQKFGGEILNYGQSFDSVSSQFWYNLYNFRKLVKRRN
jgi:lipid II:glycine glycyltransferase (peptidoglycan interpeptide bridge formation enzyme)